MQIDYIHEHTKSNKTLVILFNPSDIDTTKRILLDSVKLPFVKCFCYVTVMEQKMKMFCKWQSCQISKQGLEKIFSFFKSSDLLPAYSAGCWSKSAQKLRNFINFLFSNMDTILLLNTSDREQGTYTHTHTHTQQVRYTTTLCN